MHPLLILYALQCLLLLAINCIIVWIYQYIPAKYRYQFHLKIFSYQISIPCNLFGEISDRIYFQMTTRKKVGFYLWLASIGMFFIMVWPYALLGMLFIPPLLHGILLKILVK